MIKKISLVHNIGVEQMSRYLPLKSRNRGETAHAGRYMYMTNLLVSTLTFLIVWPIIFIAGLVYLEDASAWKKVLSLDFKYFEKSRIWFSLVFATFIASLLVVSVYI